MSVEVMSGGGASPKLQTKTATPSTSSQSVTPDDGYDGLSEVTVNAMPSGSLNSPTISSSGLVTASVGTSGYISSGTSSTLQLSTQSAKTVTPGKYSQTAVSSGKYTTGAVTVSGDSNLVASNIKSGVSIFGVSGSYTGDSMKTYETTATYSADTTTGWINTPSSNQFAPKAAIIVWSGRFRTDTCSNTDDGLIIGLYLERDSSSGTEICCDWYINPKDGWAYVYGDVYTTSNEIADYYTVSWDHEGIKITSVIVDGTTGYLFDGDYTIRLLG